MQYFDPNRPENPSVAEWPDPDRDATGPGAVSERQDGQQPLDRRGASQRRWRDGRRRSLPPNIGSAVSDSRCRRSATLLMHLLLETEHLWIGGSESEMVAGEGNLHVR